MTSPSTRAQSSRVLVAMTLANAMILVDQTAVPLTLPDVMAQFHIGSQFAQWMLTASLLPMAGLLVFGGRLGDLLGRRTVFLTGAIMFATASAIGGLAPAYWIVLVCRVVQGAGGALMLPASVALLSAATPRADRGRALGTMGGIAAIAGALGPTVGGLLTTAISWRAVLLINAPLAVVTVILTLRSVPQDQPHEERERLDLPGTVLLCLALVGLVFGLSASQSSSWDDPAVVASLTTSVVATALFVLRELRARSPLLSLSLLRTHRNYLGATLSQGLAGIAEMGLAVLFPLLLILNLEMTPLEAGVALIPTTVPMVLLATFAGRWYDRRGGRPPLFVGFLILALAGVTLAWGAGENEYLALLPGLLLYGIGLALVLTVNDPVSLDTVPDADQGQASGVSATAEQAGGAVGIAALYALFHSTYVSRLHELIDASPLKDLTAAQYGALRRSLVAAEATGLRPSHFHRLEAYLFPAQTAASDGYSAAFLATAVVALVGAALVAWLVRKPPTPAD